MLTHDYFKHSRDKTAIIKKLPQNPDQFICPVTKSDFQTEVKTSTHIFFIHDDRRVVNIYNLSQLKNCLKLLDMPPSLHSFTIGRTSELVRTATTKQLKLLARWSSDAYKK